MLLAPRRRASTSRHRGSASALGGIVDGWDMLCLMSFTASILQQLLQFLQCVAEMRTLASKLTVRWLCSRLRHLPIRQIPTIHYNTAHHFFCLCYTAACYRAQHQARLQAPCESSVLKHASCTDAVSVCCDQLAVSVSGCTFSGTVAIELPTRLHVVAYMSLRL